KVHLITNARLSSEEPNSLAIITLIALTGLGLGHLVTVQDVFECSRKRVEIFPRVSF
ncbi:hypothetical protein ACLOJK_037994, partial [Asimina triloba]